MIRRPCALAALALCHASPSATLTADDYLAAAEAALLLAGALAALARLAAPRTLATPHGRVERLKREAAQAVEAHRLRPTRGALVRRVASHVAWCAAVWEIDRRIP